MVTLCYVYVCVINSCQKHFNIFNTIRYHGLIFSGMKIIGSVCDQTSTNAGAVNLLAYPNLRKVIQIGQLFKYSVQGNTIIHCFDPPHILKSIRNNLYSKDLKHFVADI